MSIHPIELLKRFCIVHQGVPQSCRGIVLLAITRSDTSEHAHEITQRSAGEDRQTKNERRMAVGLHVHVRVYLCVYRQVSQRSQAHLRMTIALAQHADELENPVGLLECFAIFTALCHGVGYSSACR